MASDPRTWKFETLQLHAGQEEPDPATGARCVPIYQTSAYVFADAAEAAARFGLAEGGNLYSRLTNPTNDAFERRMAALEGGVGALATASGAAAVDYAVRNILRAGDHLVSSRTVYGGTYNLFACTLPEAGIAVSFFDGARLDTLEAAIRPETRAVFIESMGNPHADLIDIEAAAAIAHRHGIPLIVDNTFATPYLLRPIEHGADVVVHSASKFIGGHGTSIGGVIVDGGQFDWAASGRFPGLSQPNSSYHGVVFTEAAGKAAYITKARVTLLRDTGATLSPFNAFLFLQGLETLSLRVERHVANALRVVEYLAAHPRIERVNHPSRPESGYRALYDRYFPQGAGSIFTVEVAGGEQEARAFIDRLRIFSLLANVADVKSLVIHPASTTHAQLDAAALAACGLKPNTVRLSIGTEHIDDIRADLEQALRA